MAGMYSSPKQPLQ